MYSESLQKPCWSTLRSLTTKTLEMKVKSGQASGPQQAPIRTGPED